MSAHGVDAVLLNGAVLGHHQVGGVALQVESEDGRLAREASKGRRRASSVRERPDYAAYALALARLQALGQGVVALLVGLQPLLSLHVVAEGVLGGLASAATTSAAIKNMMTIRAPEGPNC